MIEFYKHLLSKLNVKHSSSGIKHYAEHVPFSDGMYGLRTFLYIYGIKNRCFKLTDKSQIKKLVGIRIVRINSQLFIINNIDSDADIVIISNKPGHKQCFTWQEFLQKWDGIVTIANASKKSIEHNYVENTRKDTLQLIKSVVFLTSLILLLYCISSPNLSNFNVSVCCILLLQLAGVGICILLLQQDLNIPSTITKILCGLTKQSNCNTVTKSNGSNLLGIVKLSEMGFSYFVVNFILIIIKPELIYDISIFSFCGVAFSNWSIFYQKFVIKQWCILCLSILVLIWIQAGISIIVIVDWHSLSYSIRNIITIGCLYCCISLFVNKYMAILYNRNINKSIVKQMYDLKFDDKVIYSFESEAEIFNTEPEYCSSLTFGSTDAPYQITVFSNPYCNPCADMHHRLKALPGDTVAITYVLGFFSKELSKINRYIIAFYIRFGDEKTWDMLSEWYDHGKEKGESFFKSYQLNPYSQEVENEFNKQLSWIKDDRLKGTPTILINGKELVPPYEVEEFMHINI